MLLSFSLILASAREDACCDISCTVCHDLLYEFICLPMLSQYNMLPCGESTLTSVSDFIESDGEEESCTYNLGAESGDKRCNVWNVSFPQGLIEALLKD